MATYLTNQINNQSIIPSTDVIQLTLTLKMTTAQVVETSVSVNNNSPIQDYVTTRTIKLNLLLNTKTIGRMTCHCLERERVNCLSVSRSWARVGEGPGNEVGIYVPYKLLLRQIRYQAE